MGIFREEALIKILFFLKLVLWEVLNLPILNVEKTFFKLWLEALKQA